jgi:glucuronate isomerase
MPGRSGAGAFTLHADRCFDPDPAVRRIARDLYAEARDLPIVSPHGHVDPRLLAENRPFPDPASLLVTPDHYVTRMLRSQGIAMESLGLPRRDGSPVEADPRKVWQLFAAHFSLFAGTPSGYWLEHELHELFGVRTRLTAATGTQIYDEVAERLTSPEFLPRALFDRFNIEVLATTDAASDSLEHHRAIRESGWEGRVIPTFRPDALFRIAAPGWRDALSALASAAGSPISSAAEFIGALASRRAFFRQMGATASDHGVVEPHTQSLPPGEVEETFERALLGIGTPAGQRRFEAHMLIEMARMSVDDGLVMQLHAGALRDHDTQLFEQFGADRGGDVPVATEWTRNLRPLLNAFGNDPRFTLILFTLDESTYSRELAPLAGLYPAVRLGPPWWFHDSLQGMTRYRQQTSETAGFWNTAGFNDDTRALCSIPARHDLARRMDANYLAGLVARHVIGVGDARMLGRAMACELARSAYRLGAASK